MSLIPTPKFHPDSDPVYECGLCPRLKEFRDSYKHDNPDWFNGPVPSFTSKNGDEDVRLLVIGMAPGLKGANRTGRPFTGDYAGDLLYATLKKYGFAEGDYGASPDDGLALKQAAITNAVRCVPPQNKPVGSEVNNCRPFLLATLARFPNLSVLLTLGKIAHDTTARALGERVADHPFAHNRATRMGQYDVVSSYHCSRYNTNTGRLTEAMFEAVFEQLRGLVD